MVSAWQAEEKQKQWQLEKAEGESRSTNWTGKVFSAQPQEMLSKSTFWAEWEQGWLLKSSKEHLSRVEVHSLGSCLGAILHSGWGVAQQQPLCQRRTQLWIWSNWSQSKWTRSAQTTANLLGPSWGLRLSYFKSAMDLKCRFISFDTWSFLVHLEGFA